jgi:hypothetical protein
VRIPLLKKKYFIIFQIFFHFQTTTQDGTVIDNSRKYNKPMEITLGHQFKLDCWESCLKTMRLNEIAKFSVDKEVRRRIVFYIKIKFVL